MPKNLRGQEYLELPTFGTDRQITFTACWAPDEDFSDMLEPTVMLHWKAWLPLEELGDLIDSVFVDCCNVDGEIPEDDDIITNFILWTDALDVKIQLTGLAFTDGRRPLSELTKAIGPIDRDHLSGGIRNGSMPLGLACALTDKYNDEWSQLTVYMMADEDYLEKVVFMPSIIGWLKRSFPDLDEDALRVHLRQIEPEAIRFLKENGPKREPEPDTDRPTDAPPPEEE